MATPTERPTCHQCHTRPSRNVGPGLCEACYRADLRANPRPRPPKRKRDGGKRKQRPGRVKKITTPPPLAPPHPLPESLPCEGIGASDNTTNTTSDKGDTMCHTTPKGGKGQDKTEEPQGHWALAIQDEPAQVTLTQICREALDGVTQPPWKVRLAMMMAADLDVLANDPDRTAPASLISTMADLMTELTGTTATDDISANFAALLAAIDTNT